MLAGTNCNQLVNAVRVAMELPASERKWSSYMFQEAIVMLRKLADLRNRFSSLIKVRLLQREPKMRELYRDLERVEERIENLLST